MSVVLLVLTAIGTLVAAAFCAGTETAFLSVSRERVLHLAQAGGRKAKQVQAALMEMSRTLTTLLIGNNLASVTYSAATAALIAEGCRDSMWRSIWSFLAAFIVLYVSEFLPKILCAARPLRRSLELASTYMWLSFLLRPLTNLALLLTNLFLHSHKEDRYQLTSADLLRILRDRKDGVCLSDIESALIGRIIMNLSKKKPITAEALLSVLRERPTKSW